MFDPKSDYALNKMDPEAIVYIDSRGTLIRLTVDNFADNAGVAFSKRTLSLQGLSEQTIAVQSPEEYLIMLQEQQERAELRRLLMEGVDSCLTATQRRRLWLYCVNGLTVRQIAEAEGVQHPSVVECLTAAKKKLLLFLKNMA